MLVSFHPLATLTVLLGFSYLGRGVSLHGCSSKAQLLLLTLDEGYLLTATPPELQRAGCDGPRRSVKGSPLFRPEGRDGP